MVFTITSSYSGRGLTGCVKDKIGISENVIMVSRDINMRVKAAILNIQAENFRNDKVSLEENFFQEGL